MEAPTQSPEVLTNTPIVTATASFFNSEDRKSVLELVEQVLLRLPLKDLLLAQRVCKEWRDLITTSPSLQQALFFQPATNELAIWHGRRVADYASASASPDDEYVHLPGSPFFYTFAPKNEATMKAVYDFEWNDKFKKNILNPGPISGLLSHAVVFTNPLLVSKFPWFRKFFHSKTRAPIKYINKQHSVQNRMPPAFHHPQASWHRMLITQPPLAALTARLIYPFALPWPGYPGGGLVPTIQHAHCFDLLSEGMFGEPIRMGKVQETLLELGMRFYGLKALEIKGADHFREWRDGMDLLVVRKVHPKVEEEQATGVPGYGVDMPFAPVVPVQINEHVEDDEGGFCFYDSDEEAERDAFRGMLAYFMEKGKEKKETE